MPRSRNRPALWARRFSEGTGEAAGHVFTEAEFQELQASTETGTALGGILVEDWEWPENPPLEDPPVGLGEDGDAETREGMGEPGTEEPPPTVVAPPILDPEPGDFSTPIGGGHWELPPFFENRPRDIEWFIWNRLLDRYSELTQETIRLNTELLELIGLRQDVKTHDTDRWPYVPDFPEGFWDWNPRYS